MTAPNGIRTESIRTPKASRAGALYATQLYSTPHVSHPCLSGNWGCGDRPLMDALAPLAGVIA